MSKTTTNYNLIKPELTDAADITATNGNWDKIDTELKNRATLGNDGKIPSSQLPSMNYIPTSDKGKANGVASLDSNGKIPTEQIPSNNFIVNVTDNGDAFIADKTFSEVLAAYNSGKTLMAYYNEYKLPLTMVDVNQYIVFQTGTDYGYMAFLILVDNTVGSIFETFSYAGHHHFPSDIKSGTFASYVKANANGQDPATSLLRNIKAGTSDLTAGSSSLATGELYFVYE